MEPTPDSLTRISQTLVSPCDGAKTVRTLPPPSAPSSEVPTVCVMAMDSARTDSVATVKRPTPPLGTTRLASPRRLAFRRVIALGIALTSLAWMALTLVVAASSSWPRIAETRPVTMHLVERITAAWSDTEPLEKAATPKPVTEAKPPVWREDHVVARERPDVRRAAARRPSRPSAVLAKKILEDAL